MHAALGREGRPGLPAHHLKFYENISLQLNEMAADERDGFTDGSLSAAARAGSGSESESEYECYGLRRF